MTTRPAPAAGKGPGGISRALQRRSNRRTADKIQRGKQRMMGMDMLVLHTVGARSGQRRRTPVAWFPDGEARLVVASGGGDRNPDWYTNLMAHPEQTEIDLGTGDTVPVTPVTLRDAEREQAWRTIAAAAPRIATYQSKSDRVYPVVRLEPR